MEQASTFIQTNGAFILAVGAFILAIVILLLAWAFRKRLTKFTFKALGLEASVELGEVADTTETSPAPQQTKSTEIAGGTGSVGAGGNIEGSQVTTNNVTNNYIF